jgi:hypothetical protein
MSSNTSYKSAEDCSTDPYDPYCPQGILVFIAAAWALLGTALGAATIFVAYRKATRSSQPRACFRMPDRVRRHCVFRWGWIAMAMTLAVVFWPVVLFGYFHGDLGLRSSCCEPGGEETP